MFKDSNKHINKLSSRVLVLTLSLLSGNYGGILQSYALSEFLKGQNCYVFIDVPKIKRNKMKFFFVKIKLFLINLFKNQPISYYFNDKLRNIIIKNTISFIENNINTIDICNGAIMPKRKIIKGFNVFLVGSDQVWRKSYSDIKRNLFNFLHDDSKKRIAYSASFGLDYLAGYSKSLIKKSAQLAKKFDAISVREDSGVDLCKKYWGVDAVQLIDPTMLLEKNDYVDLIRKSKNLKPSQGDIFVYVLDRNDWKKEIIKKISNNLKLKTFEIMPPECNTAKDLNKDPEKYMLPPVEQWLKSFDDAKFVITDSFHGCVFSIIFNKPFFVIANKGRGVARFTSILKLFKIQNRLVYSLDDLANINIYETINWNEVNSIIKKEQSRSKKFLLDNLGEIGE